MKTKLKMQRSIYKNLTLVLACLFLFSLMISGCRSCDDEVIAPVLTPPEDHPTGRILVSIDTGNTWQVQNVALGEKFFSVIRTYDNSGDLFMVAGTKGTFIGSRDGIDWNRFSHFTDTTILKILSPGNNSGMIAGINEEKDFLLSTNYGSNWSMTRVQEGSEMISIDIDPTNNNNLLICKELGEIFKSTNRGQNWVRKNFLIEPAYMSDIRYLSGYTALVTASVLGIYRSTDSGESWVIANTPVSFGFNSIGYNPEWQFVFVTTNTNESILRSPNNGIDWVEIKTSVGGIGNVNKIAISYAGVCIGAGNSGCILKSTDYGITWRRIESGTGFDLYDVIFVNNSFLIAVGD
ncbi:MAG: hypothetical protein HOP31_09805 [Ignavibacteria bacterium]|nr:hypothetical protein [Ignavibacteria bacterium]